MKKAKCIMGGTKWRLERMPTDGLTRAPCRYPGTTFMDHLTRYEQDPQVKMLVLLGEVGDCPSVFTVRAVPCAVKWVGRHLVDDSFGL